MFCSEGQVPDGVPATQADPLLAASWVTVYPQCSAGVVGSVTGFTQNQKAQVVDSVVRVEGLGKLAALKSFGPIHSSSGALARRSQNRGGVLWAGSQALSHGDHGVQGRARRA